MPIDQWQRVGRSIASEADVEVVLLSRGEGDDVDDVDPDLILDLGSGNHI